MCAAELEATLGSGSPILAEYIIAKHEAAGGDLAKFRSILRKEAEIDEIHIDRLHALIQTLTVWIQLVLPSLEHWLGHEATFSVGNVVLTVILLIRQACTVNIWRSVLLTVSVSHSVLEALEIALDFICPQTKYRWLGTITPELS